MIQVLGIISLMCLCMVLTRLTIGRATPRGLAALVLIATLIAASAAWAAIPSDVLLQKLQPQGNVNDYAGILTLAEREKLENRVVELRRKSAAQFAVVILKSMEGGQIDDFANKLFAKWGVGQKGKNNGLMLLVAMEERKGGLRSATAWNPSCPTPWPAECSTNNSFRPSSSGGTPRD